MVSPFVQQMKWKSTGCECRATIGLKRAELRFEEPKRKLVYTSLRKWSHLEPLQQLKKAGEKVGLENDDCLKAKVVLPCSPKVGIFW